MKPLFKTILILFFLLSAFAVKAQERITISDPEITFSYLLPEGYAYTDDPYFHYVYPTTGSKDELPRLSLTYFSMYCPNLNDCFDGKLNGELKTQFADFKALEKRDLTINSSPAIIATYTFTEKGTDLTGILCTFINSDSHFVIEAQYPSADSIMYQVVFEEIIASIEVTKN